jgi:hypothetical protein
VLGKVDAVRAIIAHNRFNPAALEKAIVAFVDTQLEKRTREDEQEVALRVCRHIHPAGPAGVYCASCHRAEMDAATNEGRPLAEGDI